MTTSIPNGFSEDQLRQLMINAAIREDADKEAEEGPYGGLTRDQICQAAEDSIDAINGICKHPLSHKLIVLQIIDNYLDWHNHMGESFIEEKPELAAGWFRDAGKFQAIMNLLRAVGVDPKDFTTSWYDDNDDDDDNDYRDCDYV